MIPEQPEEEGSPLDETTVRLAAIPLALLVAWVAVETSPGLVRLVTMWVHESGHAVTAWISGYIAFPGPWFTPVGSTRSPWFTALVLGVLGYGGYRAWIIQRWFWVTAVAAAVCLVLGCTLLLSASSAQQFITFGGDGGSMVLGTMLMLTVYAREDHALRKRHLRWAFVVIGALALVDAYAVWTGPISSLPLGENENGLSDPSVLIEQYGWNLLVLIARYQQVARACLAVLATVYVAVLCAGLFRSDFPGRPRVRRSDQSLS